MKNRISFSGAIAALVFLCLLIPAVEAQVTIDVGNRFPNSVSRLYCFTKIIGATQPTEVVHVWRYGNEERARVSLAVKAATWRTYSSKAIQDHEMGLWQVQILDAAGNLLKTIDFEITP
jgi:hypothetical protein